MADSVWSKPSPQVREIVADEMAAAFSIAEMRGIAGGIGIGRVDQPVTARQSADFAGSIVERAIERGIFFELVRRVALARPRRSTLAWLPVTLPSMKFASTDSTSTFRTTHSVDRGLELRNAKEHIVALTLLLGRICCLEADGVPLGTGILIGPDRVLTSAHLFTRDAAAPRIPKTLVFRFGYEGSDSVGTPVRVREQSPVLAWSPVASADDGGRPALDYVLLSLARSPASDVVDEASRRLRGSVDVSSNIELPPLDQIVQIFQHAEGEPTSLSIGTVTGSDREAARLYYSLATRAGSSGGGVFDLRNVPIGLHRGRVERDGRTLGQGIPMAMIVRDMERQLTCDHGDGGWAAR